MRRSQKWQLTLGLILGFAGTLESAAAHAPEVDTSLTVRVRNYSKVDNKTLAEAERVAAGIFEKAGVRTQWVDVPEIPNRSSVDLSDVDSNDLSNVRVHILSQEMANTLGMPANVMGLAPGKGPDRRLVYVFYECMRELAQRQVREQMKGDVPRGATAGEILGEMMAHELGHILLNLPLHSPTGIMRGDWDLKDLWDVACGLLLFTRQQAEVIRADVARRGSYQPSVSASLATH
jgi:hypothetical protein